MSAGSGEFFAFENKLGNVSSLLHSYSECHPDAEWRPPMLSHRYKQEVEVLRRGEVLMGSSSKCVTVFIHGSSYVRPTGSVTQYRHSERFVYD